MATPELIAKLMWPPARLLVSQNSKTSHLPLIAIVQPIVIRVHTLSESGLMLSLHFHMDQHPGLIAAPAPDLNQDVGIAPSQLGFPYDLLQLLVQKLMALLPIDIGVGLGKEETQEVREKVLKRLFPRAIIALGRVVHGCTCSCRSYMVEIVPHPH